MNVAHRSGRPGGANRDRFDDTASVDSNEAALLLLEDKYSNRNNNHSTTISRSHRKRSLEDDDDQMSGIGKLGTKTTGLVDQQYNNEPLPISPMNNTNIHTSTTTKTAPSLTRTTTLTATEKTTPTFFQSNTTIQNKVMTTSAKPFLTKAKKTIAKQVTLLMGSRVYIYRNDLYPFLHNDRQRTIMKQYKEETRFYGTLSRRDSKVDYSVVFDILPTDCQTVMVLCHCLTIVQDGEVEENMEELEEMIENDNRKNPFVTFPTEMELENELAKKRNGEKNVLDGTMIHEDGTDHPDGVDTSVTTKSDLEELPLSTIFFRDFFPNVTGHGQLMDEYLSNEKATYHAIVKKENILFHDPYNKDNNDPDWIVKQCYLVLLAAANEMDCGIDNFWKNGPSDGRQKYANFGQYIPIQYLKAFMSCAAYMFCSDKERWDVNSKNNNNNNNNRNEVELLEQYYEKRRTTFSQKKENNDSIIDKRSLCMQNLLSLEERWIVVDPLLKCVCTILGMCVVDMYRLYRHSNDMNNNKTKDGSTNSSIDTNNAFLRLDDVPNMIHIFKFNDEICSTIHIWNYNVTPGIEQPHDEVWANELLERIRDVDGNISAELTYKQRHVLNLTIGNPVVDTCYVCRRYLDNDHKVIRRMTSFWCKQCKMPLCKTSRIGNDGGRTESCLEEHLSTQFYELACNDVHVKGTHYPEHVQISLFSLKQQQSHNSNNNNEL